MNEAAATNKANKSPAEIVLLLENPSKGNNLGSILRCASASGVRQILCVGYDKCAVQGAHGAHKHVRLIAFATAAQATKALPNDSIVIGLLGAFPDGYNEEGYSVCEDEEKGLAVPTFEQPDETKSNHFGMSFPIYSLPFSSVSSGPTVCLVMSKDRLGLPVNLAEQCHTFCHVPCVSVSDLCPPLIDAPASLTITLHHLAERLGYDEAHFEGHKFHVIKPTVSAVEMEQKQHSRKEKNCKTKDPLEGGTMSSFLWADEAASGDY